MNGKVWKNHEYNCNNMNYTLINDTSGEQFYSNWLTIDDEGNVFVNRSEIRKQTVKIRYTIDNVQYETNKFTV